MSTLVFHSRAHFTWLRVTHWLRSFHKFMVLFLLYLFASFQVVSQMIEICKLFLLRKLMMETFTRSCNFSICNNVQNLFSLVQEEQNKMSRKISSWKQTIHILELLCQCMPLDFWGLRYYDLFGLCLVLSCSLSASLMFLLLLSSLKIISAQTTECYRVLPWVCMNHYFLHYFSSGRYERNILDKLEHQWNTFNVF